MEDATQHAKHIEAPWRMVHYPADIACQAAGVGESVLASVLFGGTHASGSFFCCKALRDE